MNIYTAAQNSLAVGLPCCLHLLQGFFSCGEANLGSGSLHIPLLVVAISEKMLAWPEYAGHYSKVAEHAATEAEGHFNPCIHAVAAKVDAVSNRVLC